MSRDFFTELCETLGWRRPKNSGPYRWALALSRTSLSRLHPTQVVRRAQTSAFDVGKAKQELGYDPPVTREEGMAELKAWFGTRAEP